MRGPTFIHCLVQFDNLLMETEIQDNNSDLGFHEAALVLNRLEMAESVLCAIADIDELDALSKDMEQENPI